MPCYNTVPISVIPPVSQGVAPILWQNGNQITRLNIPLNPSFLIYDGSKTRWGDGSAQAPVYLPNIQEVNSPSVTYVAGITSTGQLVKTLGVSGTGLVGGSAGAVVYQTAPSATGFTAAGTTGQVLLSNGTSAPTWSTNIAGQAGSVANGSVTPAKLSTGGPDWDANSNVTIGTTATGGRLFVNSSTTNDPEIRVQGTTGGTLDIHHSVTQGAYNGITALGDKAIIFSDTGGSTSTSSLTIAPWAPSTSGIRIAAGGNVAIGKSTPTEKLDVAGNISVGVTGNEFGVGLVQKGYYGDASNLSARVPSINGTFFVQTQNATDPNLVDTQLTIRSGQINAFQNPVINSPTTAKAWVNFNGTGTIGQPQSIRSSYNVSSVTKIGTGRYRINLISMSDDFYTAVAASEGPVNVQHCNPYIQNIIQTSFLLDFKNSANGNLFANPTHAMVQVFGN